MKNKFITIGLIFSIVFQTFGIQANDIFIKKSEKTTYHSSKRTDATNQNKSLFIEEETEENADDEVKNFQNIFVSDLNCNFFYQIFFISEFKLSKNSHYKFAISKPIFLVNRNIRI